MADRYVLPAGFTAFALNAIAEWRRINPPTRSGGYVVTDFFSNDGRGAWGVRLDYIRAGAGYDFAVFAVWYHPDTNRFAPADLAFRIDGLTTEGDIAATLNRTLDRARRVSTIAAPADRVEDPTGPGVLSAADIAALGALTGATIIPGSRSTRVVLCQPSDQESMGDVVVRVSKPGTCYIATLDAGALRLVSIFDPELEELWRRMTNILDHLAAVLPVAAQTARAAGQVTP